ncbi:hypothetical protein GYMLUDRAFT_692811 [Collybiopsis luxurians FD-317 M1]|uniref:C2H2-type domain-containing protein n=1 Tax=Collybiopsis luxurians FD-317 M1 TaxID=944289 RepID=A0A0D0CSF8_9AGAR|nr:hypothetical protein GYMLUDRAFT_692811 [Collybiopsis luxurians FD-317 M1]
MPKRTSIYLYLRQSDIPAQVTCRWLLDESQTGSSECGMSFSTLREAQSHLKRHHISSSVKTPTCRWVECSATGKPFSSRSAFDHHFHLQHHPYSRLYCTNAGCEEGFQDRRALKRHLEICVENEPDNASSGETGSPHAQTQGSTAHAPSEVAQAHPHSLNLDVQSPGAVATPNGTGIGDPDATDSGAPLRFVFESPVSGYVRDRDSMEGGMNGYEDGENEDRRKRIRLE